MYTNIWTRSFLLQKFRRAPHTLTHSQIKVHNIVIQTVIPPIFVQNFYVMYLKISYKFHRIPDTQSHVITKVYDFLGQPSYVCSPSPPTLREIMGYNHLRFIPRIILHNILDWFKYLLTGLPTSYFTASLSSRIITLCFIAFRSHIITSSSLNASISHLGFDGIYDI